MISSYKTIFNVNKTRLTFYFLMFKRDHNSPKYVEKLTKKIAKLLCHVNLIPYNSLAKNGYNRRAVSKLKTLIPL